MILRLTLAYLAVFMVVLAGLSAGAYAFMSNEYHALLGPALTTPEGLLAFERATRKVALAILGFDVPLVLAVGAASYALAQLSMRPLVLATARERRFVADAAHELRSPLATIAAVAQASTRDAEPSQRQSFEQISAAALDASALVGDLLTLAREPSARLLDAEPVDLSILVRRCVDDLRPRLDAANVRADVLVRSAIVEGDERRLRELLRNVLENAARYARERIEIVCDTTGGFARVRVADDGPGIPVAERERVFDRFYQSGNDNGERGSGLGLAIVRWIAQAHRGTVTIDRADAGGARFSVLIPLVEETR